MTRTVNKIFVIRLLSNMAKAISTQNLPVTGLGCMGRPEEFASLAGFADNLKIVPGEFGSAKTIFARFREFLILSRSIKDDRPDVIHVNALQDLLLVFIAANLFIPGKYKPIIIAMSHNPQTWKNPMKAWLATQCVRFFADGFVALATTHKNQLSSLGISENRLITIPNPYDDVDVRQNNLGKPTLSQTSESSLRVVCMATVMERKAQDILVQAAGLVLKEHPHVYFDLVGHFLPGEEAYIEKIRAIISQLNIGTQVAFAGGIPYHQVPAWLAKSDIFVFPTRSEMMPRAVIEPMLIGKPVIASAVDGILDLIQNRKTGILVQPGNVKELAEAICELIENPSLARELGLAGQKYILDFCSPERVGELFRDFYQSILDRKYQSDSF